MARCSPMSLLSTLSIHYSSRNRLSFFISSAARITLSVMAKMDGLISSLNSQLLSLYDFDLGFVRFGQWYKGLRQLDLRTLCRLFRKLV